MAKFMTNGAYLKVLLILLDWCNIRSPWAIWRANWANFQLNKLYSHKSFSISFYQSHNARLRWLYIITEILQDFQYISLKPLFWDEKTFFFKIWYFWNYLFLILPHIFCKITKNCLGIPWEFFEIYNWSLKENPKICSKSEKMGVKFQKS